MAKYKRLRKNGKPRANRTGRQFDGWKYNLKDCLKCKRKNLEYRKYVGWKCTNRKCKFIQRIGSIYCQDGTYLTF